MLRLRDKLSQVIIDTTGTQKPKISSVNRVYYDKNYELHGTIRINGRYIRSTFDPNRKVWYYKYQ